MLASHDHFYVFTLNQSIALCEFWILRSNMKSLSSKVLVLWYLLTQWGGFDALLQFWMVTIATIWKYIFYLYCSFLQQQKIYTKTKNNKGLMI